MKLFRIFFSSSLESFFFFFKDSIRSISLRTTGSLANNEEITLKEFREFLAKIIQSISPSTIQVIILLNLIIFQEKIRSLFLCFIDHLRTKSIDMLLDRQQSQQSDQTQIIVLHQNPIVFNQSITIFNSKKHYNGIQYPPPPPKEKKILILTIKILYLIYIL